MVRTKKSNIIRDNIKGFLFGVAIVAVITLVVSFFLRSSDDEDISSASGLQGNIYICNGCGKEYVNQFPYTSPWAGYPTELPAHNITDTEETPDNSSVARATPVSMFQRITGNLSSIDDKDFYSFTVEAAGSVRFDFSFDGSSGGYTYLWDGAIYGSDGETELRTGSIPSKNGEVVTFSTGESVLEPGTYYLEVSAASGENPFMNGYSDTNYHITFLPRCTEHTLTTQILTATPTCSQAGELTTVCNICDEQIFTEPLESLGHIWSTWKLTEENFFSSIWGSYSRVCASCGEEEESKLLFHFSDGEPKTDPDAVTVTELWTQVGTAPCASEGLVKTVCSVCGNVEIDSKEAEGHSYGEWVTLRDATCSSEGQRHRTCAACGHVETETLNCIPHTYGKAIRVSGSILDAPIVSQKTCTECGYVDTVESSRSQWILPVLAVLGAAAVFTFAALVLRMIRKLLQRNAKKRMGKTFLCPYCLKTSPIRQVQFQCTDQRCRSSRSSFASNHIQLNARGLPSARCSCGRITYKTVCPGCQKLLPESTLMGKDMIISVVGSHGVGKTHFISVIINEFIERIVPAFGGSFEGFADTTDLYTRIYKRQLYDNLRCLDGTDSFQNNVKGEDSPLIYTLKLQKKGPFGLGEKVRLFTLVFFDSAGVDLQQSEKNMRELNRYICKSKGIIFLIDPLKIPTVRARLDEGEVQRASTDDFCRPDDILARISSLIRDDDKGLRGSDKIEVPVSVVLTKFDVIEPNISLIPRDFTVLEPSPHCKEGAFDLSDGQNVDVEVQGLLQDWDEKSFLHQLKMNYKSYSCFAVSALGMHNTPGNDGTISRPHPHRIEDPLLWLLMKQKVIETGKNQIRG